MNIDRIKEIQEETDYPESISVQQALLKVWNETEQAQLRKADVKYQLAISALEAIIDPIGHMRKQLKEDGKLAGMYAVVIAERPDFYKDINKEALEEIANYT